MVCEKSSGVQKCEVKISRKVWSFRVTRTTSKPEKVRETLQTTSIHRAFNSENVFANFLRFSPFFWKNEKKAGGVKEGIQLNIIKNLLFKVKLSWYTENEALFTISGVSGEKFIIQFGTVKVFRLCQTFSSYEKRMRARENEKLFTIETLKNVVTKSFRGFFFQSNFHPYLMQFVVNEVRKINANFVNILRVFVRPGKNFQSSFLKATNIMQISSSWNLWPRFMIWMENYIWCWWCWGGGCWMREKGKICILRYNKNVATTNGSKTTIWIKFTVEWHHVLKLSGMWRGGKNATIKYFLEQFLESQ